MDHVILELYECMNQEKIRNCIGPKFWVYHTENFFYKDSPLNI